MHFDYKPKTSEPNIYKKRVTVNTDTVGSFRPPTAAQYQSERPIAVIQASTKHYSRNFDLPMFCDTGADIDICSLTTAQMYRFRIPYDKGKHNNIYDV